MTTTFYGVLGVEPDAEADAIRRGYRERAREVHPDVNDDPDADSQFRRLTTAKETLLDESERERYDRLGHASYVRHHASGSAWEVDDASEHPSSDRGSGGRATGGADEPASASANRTNSNRSTPGNTDARGRAHGRSAHTDGRRSAAGDGHGMGPGDGYRPGQGGDSSAGPGSSVTGAGDAADAWWTHRDPGGNASDETGANRSVGESYGASSFWDTQRVGERYSADAQRPHPFLIRLVRGVRSLGLWVFVHLAFLSLALGTALYVYAVVIPDSARTLASLFVLFGAVVFAGLLSTMHVVSRVYR